METNNAKRAREVAEEYLKTHMTITPQVRNIMETLYVEGIGDMHYGHRAKMLGRQLRPIVRKIIVDAICKEFEPLVVQIRDIFNHGRFESFENGMDSIFSRSLESIIGRHGNDAVREIARIIDDVCPVTAEEAIRCLGRIEDVDTHASRLDLLIRCLESTSYCVRDGAGIGLDSLGDASAIPALRKAIECESNEHMRKNLELVIEDLEAEQHANCRH